jgi:hypothetical protein
MRTIDANARLRNYVLTELSWERVEAFLLRQYFGSITPRCRETKTGIAGSSANDLLLLVYYF